ncbi:hypothetical protein AMS68_005259 [Peltaster fructicola]|uniref:GED domain-containing protein n=1 Tax=Peltaster fructicola TaxID=286661 RepID=A0A6H0XY94_9PEZI|nr:hypothetical protein AMS68_005259 [Peltaster fructicola]
MSSTTTTPVHVFGKSTVPSGRDTASSGSPASGHQFSFKAPQLTRADANGDDAISTSALTDLFANLGTEEQSRTNRAFRVSGQNTSPTRSIPGAYNSSSARTRTARSCANPAPSFDPVSLEQSEVAMHELQGESQADLLNTIDNLRLNDIDADINIPQIVVCGDQSSGKSALLEAISRLPFPSGSGTTTRFATEMILRKSATESISVAFRPHTERNAIERERLKAWKVQAHSLSDFPRIYGEASRFLKEIDPLYAFHKDHLVVTVTGPEQPHLTLVDLPGLIKIATTQEGGQTAITAVQELVEAFLKRERTLVLAVVNAAYDLQNQSVLHVVKKHALARSVGIITHADAVQTQEERRKWLDIVKNEQYKLGLGWHVVCNLNHEATDRTPAARDSHESEVLGGGVWQHLSKIDRGIQALRQKLGKHLFSIIKQDLPALQREMAQHLIRCERDLQRLGAPRDTAEARKLHLVNISSRLKSILTTALVGAYETSDHTDFFAQDKDYRLRDKVRFILEALGVDLAYTTAYTIKADGPDTDSDSAVEDVEFHFNVTSSDGSALPRNADGLPGTIPQTTIQLIFRQQSVHWRAISERAQMQCLELTEKLLRAAMDHVAGEHTADLLWNDHGSPLYDYSEAALANKLNELLWPFEKSHPIICNVNALTQLRTPSRAQDQSKDSLSSTAETWAEGARSVGWPHQMVLAAEAVDREEQYRQVARNNLVDNIATLSIERCLLSRIADVFTPELVAGLGPEAIDRLGEEPSDVTEERSKTQAKVQALRAAIKTCRKYITSSRRAMMCTLSQLNPSDEVVFLSINLCVVIEITCSRAKNS